LEKVIIVGPVELHTFFTSYYPDWDTQIPVERVADVWNGLNNGSISPESSAVVFTDADFQDTAEYNGVVEAVATFTPEATVLVIFYDTNNYENLRVAVSQKQTELDLPQADFFPIDAASNVGEEISKAFEHYNNQVVERTPAGTGAYSNINEATEQVSYEPANRAGKKRGLIVASTSSKGGSGKTTVGMVTAAMFYHASKAAVDQGLREAPLRVCLVDMDIRDGQIGFIIQQLAPTALNIFLETNKDKETIMDNLVYDERLGVHALLAPKRARTADFLSPEFYMHVIDQLAEMFDVVVLDTSVDYTDVLLSKVVFPVADAIMFVTNLSVGSVYGMNRWMDEVTTPAEEGGPGISKSKIGIVVNQSAPDLGIDEELLRHAAAGAELLVAIPLDTSGVVAASNHNRLSDIITLHNEISPAYYHIVKQLLPNEVFADPLIGSNDNAQPAVRGGSGKANPPASSSQAKKRKKLGLF
jgi:septum formation inhibitor-activating ATPase MinD